MGCCPSVDVDRLTLGPLFAGLSDEDRGRVAESMLETEVEAGDTLCLQGEFAYHFFVIESGEAEVIANDSRIAELGAGDFFGELGLLLTGRRTASVVAMSPMRLLVMFEQPFRQLEHDAPAVVERIRAALRERPWTPSMPRAS